MTPSALAHICGVPRVALYAEIPSTMDVAHELAERGAPSGTVVLTDRQMAGRGRSGRAWSSPPGAGITMTLIERLEDPQAVPVLSLRLGLHAAPILDMFATDVVRLKWPNDLLLPAGKLCGILVEARWHSQQLEWVAIGIGVNVAMPEIPGTAGLAAGAHRIDVLRELLPALRAGAAVRGGLSREEIDAFESRDWARGRMAVSPAAGTVRGLSPSGALIIETAAGPVECMTGSLVLTGT